MPDRITQALEALRGLGSPDELRRGAERGLAPTDRPRVNSHIHLPPNFSAFESVQQAVDLAAGQGIGVLGVSNYYDYRVYGDFADRARRADVFPLFGLEIISMLDDLRDADVRVNDPGNPGKTYICGKGMTKFTDDRLSRTGADLLHAIRRNEAERMRQMIGKVEAIFAERGLPTGTTEPTVIDMIVRRHGSPRQTVYIQERHIAQAFCEALFAKTEPDERLEKLNTVLGGPTQATSPDEHVTIQGDIRSHLMKSGKPAFVAESFLSFADARTLILEMGGIPAYPTLADGTSPICGFEDDIDKLIAGIRDRGVCAAEFIPIRNTPDVLDRYVKTMRQAGLAITAGTEHNTLDRIPIEPTCVGGEAVPDDVKAIFWEGACVAAAHQFVTLHGETGFVDATGRPNDQYDDDHARIEAFARLGAAVVETYYRDTPHG